MEIQPQLFMFGFHFVLWLAGGYFICLVVLIVDLVPIEALGESIDLTGRPLSCYRIDRRTSGQPGPGLRGATVGVEKAYR